jgi:hypothetical protein
MKTKTCPRCNRTLDVAEFNWRNRAKGRLQPYCRACSREYVRDHYLRNQTYYVAKAVARNAVWHLQAAGRVLAYLRDHACVDCSESDPVVLEFDHLVPSEKQWNVARMVKDGLGWDTIQKEIAKCAVRCANCHRRRTARQFGWYRFDAVALAPVAQLDRAPAFEAGGLQVRSLSGAPLYRRECHGAMSRSACDLVNLRAVALVLMATCVVLALTLWRPDSVRAAPATGCIAGLPDDLTTQLQPLIEALCEASQSGASGTGPSSQNQKDLELIAETLALLTLADPGYGYAPPGYGSPPPSYSTLPPAATVAPEPAATQAMSQADEPPVDLPADQAPAEPQPDEVAACASGPP